MMGQQPVFKYLREAEGLNSNRQWSNEAVHVDDQGFVWIATSKGLNRFDGQDVVTFEARKIPPYIIPYPLITAITEDNAKRLWLGTEEEGIIIFDKKVETFEFFKSEHYLRDSLKFHQINNVVADKNGHIFIATAFQGVFKYELKENKLSKLNIQHPSWSPASTNNIALLKNNDLIVLSFNGVFYGKVGNNYTEWEFYPTDRSLHLKVAIELPNGNIRLSASNQAMHYLLNPKERTFKSYENKNKKITCTELKDSKNNIWTSSQGGFLTKEDWESKEITEFSAFADIAGSRFDICMLEMEEDAYQNIHYMSVATGAGSFNQASNPFHFLNLPISGLIKIRNNKVYVSQAGELLVLKGDKYLPILKTSDRATIMNFEVDQKGNFWISRGWEGQNISIFDSLGNQIGPRYPEVWVTELVELSNGDMTVSHHLDQEKTKDLPYYFIGDHYERLSGKEYPDFKSKYHIQKQNGDIWIATFADGILEISNSLSEFQFFPINPLGEGQLNSNNPYYIFEARNETVYVCTDRGINIWNPKSKTFSYITNEDANVTLDVKGMVETEDGDIWMVLKDQVAKIDPESQQFSSYDLPFNYFIERVESQDLQVDQDGNIYFSARAGIVRFHPQMLDTQRPPNNILFTKLFVDRNEVYPNDEHRILDSAILFQNEFQLPFEYRDLGFTFVSPHGQEIRTSYFYRLRGYKDEWKKAPKNRTIHFTSLDPGKYVMEVKAQSGGGLWAPEIGQIKFKIHPPWYQRWWAYLLYFFCISLLAYSFYKWRINQLLKYQALRTKISSDLHDDVGSLLSSIAMEAEMLSYDKESKISVELKRLSNLTRNAMGRMRDTVWAIDSRKDKFKFLADRMKDYLNDTLRRSDFEYEFLNDDRSPDKQISPDVRQNIYLVFKEAIANILKHSNGDTIFVHLKSERKKRILTVRDNGTLTQELKDKISTIKDLKDSDISGLGLSNMQMRTKNINAELTINTRNGFEIKVIF